MKPVLLPLAGKRCQAFYLRILLLLQQAGVGGSAANWPFPGTMRPRGEVSGGSGTLPFLLCPDGTAQEGPAGKQMRSSSLTAFFHSERLWGRHSVGYRVIWISRRHLFRNCHFQASRHYLQGPAEHIESQTNSKVGLEGTSGGHLLQPPC